MNRESFDNDERALARALHGKVEQMDESPLGMQQVTERATTIRRNRRIVAGVGLAAAAVILVPTAILGSGLVDRDAAPPVTTNTPSQTATEGADPSESPTPTAEEPTMTAEDGVLLLDPEAPVGAAPAMPHLVQDGSVLVRADGTTVELDESYQAIAAYAAPEMRYLLTRYDDDGLGTTDILADTGSTLEVVAQDIGTSGVVGTSDGEHAAYATTDGELVALWNGGEASFGKPANGKRVTLLAMNGWGSCMEAEGSGCSLIYVTDPDREPQVVHSHGNSDLLSDRAIAFGDIEPTRDTRVWQAVVQLSYSDTGSCWGLLDGEFGWEPKWETCDHSLYDLSPDGRTIVGSDPYGDGIGPPWTALVDARNGKQLLKVQIDGPGYVSHWVWEDAEHLLVRVHDATGWNLYRIGVDGTGERALETASGGDEMIPAWYLPSHG